MVVSRSTDGEPTTDHFGDAAPLTEAALVGPIAVRQPGKKLLWDSARMTFPDNPAAQALVRPSYRKGWEFAGI